MLSLTFFALSLFANLGIQIFNYIRGAGSKWRKTVFALGILSIMGMALTFWWNATQVRLVQWSALDSSTTDKLATRIKDIRPHQIMVACAGLYCRDLADNLVAALNKGGWNATPHHGGGLGVDGVVGLRLDQCGPDAVALQRAIQDITALAVECVPLPPNIPTPAVIGLTVGTKPF